MTMTRRRLLDNTFKKTVVGNPAIATDSLARMYPGIEMQGWTEQDGTPTPEAPVPIVSAGDEGEINVTVQGGNLFDKSTITPNKYIDDIDGEVHDNTSGIWSVSDYINVAGMSFIFATKMESGNWMAFYDSEKTYISGSTGIGYGVPITVPENARYARFTVEKNSLDTFMVNAGSTALPYEPYRPPQTVTLTADRPLTKWDKLEKRNGQWGWVYKSMEADMSSEVTWVIHPGYEQETSNLFRGAMSGVYKIDSTDRLFCNILPYRQTSSVDTNGTYSLSNYFFARIVGIKYLEDFQERIQGGKILAKLSTETFVPLTTAEQEAMNALYTYRPTTVLSNQQDCDMTLTYKSRKGMS